MTAPVLRRQTGVVQDKNKKALLENRILGRALFYGLLCKNLFWEMFLCKGIMALLYGMREARLSSKAINLRSRKSKSCGWD